MKYFLMILALMAVGCVPSQNDSAGQDVPIKETLNGYDAETTANGETINDDGTISQSYTVKIPVIHGKPIKSTWQGKVVSITDGDTIKVLNDENEQIKVRLESIDTPERKQPFGEAAKDLLGTWIHEKTVVVKETGKDRYGLTLAFIELPLTDGTLDICREMVGMGYAWEYKQYSKSETLGAAEAKARNGKLGLWAGEGPDDQIAPWEWRKRK